MGAALVGAIVAGAGGDPDFARQVWEPAGSAGAVPVFAESQSLEAFSVHVACRSNS